MCKFKEFQDRFWSRINKLGPIHPIHGQCWEWIGGKDKDGYGRIKYLGKTLKTHRVAFEFATGIAPINCVIHKCDNPPCANPSHLEEGTNQENTADKVNKNRQYRPIGEKNTSAKLTPQDIENIRTAHKSGRTQRSVADEYGISYSHMSGIINGMFWKE